MGTRRTSREMALQLLFYGDISCYNRKTNLEFFCAWFPFKKKAEPFFKRLVEGVWDHKENIDKLIESHSNNWKMYRITCVDRNILRIAAFELIYCNDIPHRVSINEAVDLGKHFGTKESGSFINGILDSINLAIYKNDL